MKHNTDITQLEKDNHYLIESIAQLNECYKEKVKLLQIKLAEQKRKNHILIEERKNYEQTTKKHDLATQSQLKIALENLEALCGRYSNEQKMMEEEMGQKERRIWELEEENKSLRMENEGLRNEKEEGGHVQQMLGDYLSEIGKLKMELGEQRKALGDISNNGESLIMLKQ